MFIHRIGQRLHCVLAESGLSSVQGTESTSLDEDGLITVILVVRQQLTNLHLDELVHLLVSDQVTLVQEHDNALDADLSAEQDVLTRLGHGAVSGRNDKNATVHTGGTSDHVFDVICMAWTIDVAFELNDFRN